ncbi:MAG: molybdopterin-dependent oxidoreductase [Bryobacteraceae bacterium]
MIATYREISRRTRRSFLTGGIAAAAGLGTWEWIRKSFHEGGIPRPLRRAEQADDVFSHALFSETRLAKTFSRAEITEARVNSDIGIQDDPEPDWKLEIEGGSAILLDQIKALPKVEQITQFKCIEGWNYIMKWGGAKFSDFAAAYAPSGATQKPWVGLETPDGDYYVGLDRASAMHPQTLLAYEMNSEPLTNAHGAPLRLLIPVKYGIKNLKRIGKITFSDTKPRDYWAENGYDYDSGF